MLLAHCIKLRPHFAWPCQSLSHNPHPPVFLSCHLGISNTINCYERCIQRNGLPSLGYSCKTLRIECHHFAWEVLKTGPRDAQSHAHITTQLLTHFHLFKYAIGIHLIFNSELNVCNFRSLFEPLSTQCAVSTIGRILPRVGSSMLVQSAKIGAPLVNVDSMQWWDSTKKKLKRLYGQRVGPKTFSKLRRIKKSSVAWKWC